MMNEEPHLAYKDVNGDTSDTCELLWTYAASYRKKSNFLKGCKWSPDGKCLLAASDDHTFRLYDLPLTLSPNNDPSIDQPALTVTEGGIIYDYAWFPYMNSSNPISCVFLSTSGGSPIHLWDAYTGQLRASYLPINQVDEVMSAYSVCFAELTGAIYAGFKKEVRIFDINRPGRESQKRVLKTDDIKQTGISSSIALHPTNTMYAVGSYDKTVGIYAEPEGTLEILLNGSSGGITQVMFSHDGGKLFTGSRMDSEILCWDLRSPGKLYFTIQRTVKTHQRIYFDITENDQYLVTGSTDGTVSICDMQSEVLDSGCLKNIQSFEAHKDCANGVSINPVFPLLATASGQRHFDGIASDEDSDSDTSADDEIIENCAKVWKFPNYNFDREQEKENKEND